MDLSPLHFHGLEQAAKNAFPARSLFRSCCAISLIQFSSSLAHFDIGVAHCTPWLWNPTFCSTVQRNRGPMAYTVLHNAVVLHARMERRARMIGTSPSHITIEHGPCHCNQIVARNLICRQRQIHLFHSFLILRDAISGLPHARPLWIMAPPQGQWIL